MKAALCLAAFGLAIVLIESERCINHRTDNCTVQCSANKKQVCEIDICTCGDPCLQKMDCSPCTSPPDPSGQTHQVDAHCIDGTCTCDPHLHPPNNNGHPHGPPGGNH